DRSRLPVVDQPAAVPSRAHCVEPDHEDSGILVGALRGEEGHREPDPFHVRELQLPPRRGDGEWWNPRKIPRVPLLARVTGAERWRDEAPSAIDVLAGYS